MDMKQIYIKIRREDQLPQPSHFYNPRDKGHADAHLAAAHCPRNTGGTPAKMASLPGHRKRPGGSGRVVILRRGCSLGSLSGASPPPPKLRRASAPLLRPDPYPAFGTPALPSLPPHPCRLGGGRPGSAQPGKWRRAPAGSSRPPVAPAVPGHSVVQAAGPTYLSRMGGAAKASSPRGGVGR